MKAYMLRNAETGKYYCRRGWQSSPAVWTSKQGPAAAKGSRYTCPGPWETVEFDLVEVTQYGKSTHSAAELSSPPSSLF